jgi:8-oxo-dGTP pyrophosphatase MutT (NUDIX family)
MTPKLVPSCVCFLVVKHIDGAQHVLAAYRKKSPDKPGFPGGKIEGQDKNAFHAALRELWEETGIRVKSAMSLYLGVEGDGQTVTETFFAVQWDDSQEPVSRPGEGKVAWITWEEMFEKSPFADYNRRVFHEFTRPRGPEDDLDGEPTIVLAPTEGETYHAPP